MKITHSSGSYEILFQPLQIPSGIVVTDSNVFAAQSKHIQSRETIVLNPGEESKSLAVFGELCRTLSQRGVSRSSTLIAFGGGVIGDLVGFAAATYMRGINFVQIPTTLVSQIDSSVGGKTGIDLPEGKNLVGAFYPASRVLIDTSILGTLPERQFRSGVAEVLKTGLIQSSSMFDLLANSPLKSSDSRLETVIQDCVKIKARIVEEDEFEKSGLRAQLNFGHTVGHALEQVTNYSMYTHGEAIAIGMVVETRIGELLGYSRMGLTQQVKSLMIGHELPTKAVELIDVDRIISTMRRDKKSHGGELTMSLIERPGQCSLISDIDVELVKEVLREFAKS